ncbi:UDP-N-acetylmuramoyl-L-alanyl-D-glutamate--2,6-diaminopimelate ligase [Patescibacteria group bacterium]|nr:UDP-N-acetylmuramoyl-L-alanyl-D-glutamate--2,6-diaminopimelate ligase [Patescibacteria group bacterium]MCG2702383.1 UDP-N-acetylmuramoyl-L-alanyl-D-glutamate--2,6-diaminopimelate ligase [Candidatus Parcubacteria bacterium]MBU4264846.1 UDP-N-acetylmuramoyl-L-alanyl-D-glutamate--2,6-diaminopimelate ligase [Patescibacteria group bacterium]MBU4389717.1 UDP-N-acetylmuramoyl-L-alanyl-D-glutamate--2,6-diaminopimelate ligase [Patescibacteria group bacterium]MBU4397412.1 UDP-N-acetylmuramoyl-L-alanyl
MNDKSKCLLSKKKVGNILKYLSDDIVNTVFFDKSINGVEVSDICFDSREVKQNAIFVANQGRNFDSHKFIQDVKQQGAVCCIVSELQEGINIPQVQVKDTREAVAKISNYYFGFPSKEISVIGVTGSSGKTSTIWMLASILKLCGKQVDAFGSYTSGALFSFTGVKSDSQILEANRIVERIRLDADGGKNAVVMEVNSYDLALKRVDSSMFTGAIFTNISNDHIDYHGTFAEYLATKKHLGDLIKSGGFIVTNKDDSTLGQDKIFPSNLKVLTFSTKDKMADLYAEEIIETLRGTIFCFTINGASYQTKINLMGAFQVQNCLAAILAAAEMGVSIENIVKVLPEITVPPGRYQIIEKNDSVFVVDYAHNESSLSESLNLSRSLVKGRVIAVYGGEWDGQNQKRRLMGQVIGEKADIVVITTNNPKLESVDVAVKEIKEGVIKSNSAFITIPDRRLAIKKALEIRHPGDLIIVLGSGHHNLQQIGSEKIPFNDYLVLKELLENE